ncbi:MAG TPA: response regulator [Burkholderiales bacterium]|nr:response regulator [Burkholderiales bacterium]
MPTGSLRKPTVLAVDDKPANLLALAALLEDEYDVLFADSGAAALALLRQRANIDVILLDIQMPGMDGFETAAAIKRIEAVKETPIIFVTAVFHEDPHIKRGYAVGGVDYFSKPFDPDILKLKLRIYASFRTRESILKQREFHLRESEELLRVGQKLSSLLESLTVGVLIADVAGRICQTTEEVSRILKSTQPTLDDAYGEILKWWDQAGRMIKSQEGPLARAIQEGRTSHSEPTEITCLDGSKKTILLSASPLRGLDSRLVGAVILVQDMTEPKKIEEALADRVTRLIGLGVELEESAVRS